MKEKLKLHFSFFAGQETPMPQAHATAMDAHEQPGAHRYAAEMRRSGRL
jgi:hypothetical protein